MAEDVLSTSLCSTFVERFPFPLDNTIYPCHNESMLRQQKLNRSISFFVGHTQNRCHRTLHTLLRTAIFGIKQELDQHRAPILRRQSLVQEHNEPVPSLSSPTQTITLDDANSITLRSQRLANFLSKSFSMALMVLQPVLICPQSEIIAPHSDIRNTGSMGWRRPCCLLPAGLAGAYQAASTDITIRFSVESGCMNALGSPKSARITNKIGHRPAHWPLSHGRLHRTFRGKIAILGSCCLTTLGPASTSLSKPTSNPTDFESHRLQILLQAHRTSIYPEFMLILITGRS